MWNSIKKNKKFILLFALLVFYIIISFFMIYNHCLKPAVSSYVLLEEFNQEYSERNRLHNNKNDTQKYILLWTPFFTSKNWNINKNDSDHLMLDKQYFEKINCPVTSCIITNIKNLLHSPDLYDAVLFHFSEPFSLRNKIPRLRNPRQFYVGASLESPANTKHSLNKDKYFFNWTMTYRMDSDIVWPYNEIQTLDSKHKMTPSICPNWKQPDHNFSDENYLNRTRKKTKLVAWFVSNCNAHSKRGSLVKDLQKHLQIDIYGKCGKLKCPRTTEQECFDMLEDNYKFYLAFENSLCEDYVTEKLFTSMTRLVIPVVFGGANYTRFAPPHSYVNANDFNDTISLAKYLIFLDKNPDEYVKYFWWKKHYQVRTPTPFCDLCMKLHEVKNINKMQFYEDIQSWWFADMCTRKPFIQFESNIL